MADQWQVSRGGKQHGPFTTTKLKQLASEGRVQPTDLLRKDGMQKWVPASSVKGLFPAKTATRKEDTTSGKPPAQPPLPPKKEAGKEATGKQPTDRVGSYVFGSLLFLFFVGVFCFAPSTLPEFKQRMLAVSSALLAGIFAIFMSGSLGIQITGMKSPLGKIALRASGGTGVFTLVLVWWLSPLAPVKPTLELKPIQFFPDANQVSVMDKDVKQIDYSFDGVNWKLAQGLQINETGFEGTVHATARIDEAGLRKHNKVFIKYVTQKGQESSAKEFTYDTSKAASLGKPLDPKKDPDLGKTLGDLNLMTKEKLDWHERTLRSEDFKKLEKALMLRELVLSGATFSEGDLKHLPPGLRKLNLENTKVTDKGIQALGLRPQLQELNLSGTGITDATLELFGRTPSWRFEILDLSNTQVTDGGLKHLLKEYLLLQPKEIRLKGTKVTPAGVNLLRNKWGKSCTVTD